MRMDKLDEVRAYLNSGVMSQSAIARALGVKQTWLSGVARGVIVDPGYRRIEQLWAYLVERQDDSPRPVEGTVIRGD